MKELLQKIYVEKFGTKASLIVRSPGRINIIGEHTDYNDGFVLPAAIDKAVYMAISEREDDELHLYAADFNESYNTSLSTIEPLPHHWATYVMGVVRQFQKRQCRLKGFNAVLVSDLPIGAGISSSAALESAVAIGVNELFQCRLDKLTLVKMAQMAEHEFAGVKCGIMDMFASIMGKAEHCIKLDCLDLSYEYVPLELKGYSLVLLNTNVKHSLASSAYNTRRNECARGVELIKTHQPHVKSLRDVNMAMLDEYVLPVDALVYQRCKFVVEEIERLQNACIDLQQGNIKALGKKMLETHEGLSKSYEVSCKELDFLVDKVRGREDVLGARMMGGGFGGCTINIIKEEKVDELVASIKHSYEQEMNLPLTVIKVKTANGTELL